MVPIYRPSILDNCLVFDLNMIYNNETLNVFSDASMRKNGCNKLGAYCYGSAAVNIDRIIEEDFHVVSKSTTPCAELMGIRSSLFLALRHRHEYRVINIFSDSAYSIQSIRDYIYNWCWNDNEQCFYYGKLRKKQRLIRNQDLIYENYCLLNELRKTNIVNIFHQKAHVYTVDDIYDAVDTFRRINGFNGKISFNLIRYISFYNEYIDNKSRDIIRTIDLKYNYRDALKFKPTPESFMD